MECAFSLPRVTKDGVTIAKEIELADRFENIDAQMLRKVAAKTNDVAGDSTTTATALVQAMIVDEDADCSCELESCRSKKRILISLRTKLQRFCMLALTRISSLKEIAQVVTTLANNQMKNWIVYS